MKRRRLMWIGLILLCLLLVANGVLAMSSAGYKLDWFVPLTGSGSKSASTNYQANITMGQTGIGLGESAGYESCIGYWCGAAGGYQVFLPMIRR